MKTEEEARKAWCPFAHIPGRVTGRDSVTEPTRTLGYCSQNRGMETGIALEGTRCIASECMAWRQTVGTYDREESRFVRPNESWSTSARYEERFRPEGYCGLAGKP